MPPFHKPLGDQREVIQEAGIMIRKAGLNPISSIYPATPGILRRKILPPLLLGCSKTVQNGMCSTGTKTLNIPKDIKTPFPFAFKPPMFTYVRSQPIISWNIFLACLYTFNQNLIHAPVPQTSGRPKRSHRRSQDYD
ncbi:hypothetical protein CDAR_385711 [Caerostris darwini]|uniref:Uncharacterized protein n=1 Tax=Caerostris darwini TaxID=1538125 RepID=A0AAV4M448_9ARAC|nr:hypothetical protein CDAR_385711 [Caerostris darwini]